MPATQESFLAQKDALEKMIRTLADDDYVTTPYYEYSMIMMSQEEKENCLLSKSSVLLQESFLAQNKALKKMPKTLVSDNDVTSLYDEDNKLMTVIEETETLLSKNSVLMTGKEEVETLFLSKSSAPMMVTEGKTLMIETKTSLTTDIVLNSTISTTKSALAVIEESVLPETVVNMMTANFTQVANEQYLSKAQVLSQLHVSIGKITVTEEVLQLITRIDRGNFLERVPLLSPSDVISTVHKLTTIFLSDVKLSDPTSVAEGMEDMHLFDEPETVKEIIEENLVTSDTWFWIGPVSFYRDLVQRAKEFGVCHFNHCIQKRIESKR